MNRPTRVLLASFISGLSGTPGRQVRFAMPRFFGRGPQNCGHSRAGRGARKMERGIFS